MALSFPVKTTAARHNLGASASGIGWAPSEKGSCWRLADAHYDAICASGATYCTQVTTARVTHSAVAIFYDRAMCAARAGV